MSDFTDALIDGPQPSRRIPYWKSKFAEQQELVQRKNRELVELRAENERLLGILQFSRWAHDTHRPSYALNCLYEGEITIAKFCEWMKAFVAGVDEPLPDVKYRSCGSEFTPKELEAENERLRAALERNVQGYRNIIEMRQMTNGRFGDLTREELEQSICENQAALAGKEREVPNAS